MELLTYNQAYEAQVVELWNQELFADPITVHKFRRQALLDDNFGIFTGHQTEVSVSGTWHGA